MARKPPTPELMEDIESGAERLAAWVGANAWLVGGMVVLCLAVAGGVSGYRSWHSSRERAASDALDRAQAAYLRAMGASPGALEVPELANPAAAERVRQESVDRYREVAQAHAGTVASALAQLAAADLLGELAKPDEQLEALEGALDAAAGRPPLRALVQQRLAQFHERAGAWAEAAAAHEAAAANDGYPLRYRALAEAARCYAQAGDAERARSLYERVAREAPDLDLPDYMRAEARELEAAVAGS